MRLHLSDVSFLVAPKKELWELSIPFGGMRTAILNPQLHTRSRVVLARDPRSDQLVGWCMYRPIQEPLERSISNDVMFWYFVRPDLRLRGIGRMLAKRAHEKAQRRFHGADRFTVSLLTNDVGRTFFKHVVPKYALLACS